MSHVPTTSGRLTRPPVESWVEGPEDPGRPLSANDARGLAALYWSSLRRTLHHTVRAVGDPLGPVELRLLGGRGPLLIGLGRAVVDASSDRVHVAFPVCSGLAVGTAGGRLLLAVERAPHG